MLFMGFGVIVVLLWIFLFPGSCSLHLENSVVFEIDSFPVEDDMLVYTM